VEIFIANTNDIPKILEVADATWKQTYAGIISQEQIDFMYEHMYSYDALKEQMNNGLVVLLYEEAGKPLGYIAYEFKTEQPDDPNGRMIKCIYVPKLYIKPEVQGKGIGSKLLSEVERIGGENECHFIELNVNRNNPAFRFYEKLGFFVYKSVDIPYDKFWLNDFILRKSIQFVAP
jgi:ribosomal protein S18 acetylase RimI-like enzyme